jgi:phospholipase/carboxylesterase
MSDPHPIQVEIEGVAALQVGAARPGCRVVVLLHGFAMTPDDLAPFAKLLGEDIVVLLPRGGILVPPGTLDRTQATHTWWPVDSQARAEAMRRGPRDLSENLPHGTVDARERLEVFVEGVRRHMLPTTLIVGGFSQGAMLALDWMLERGPAVDGLILLSGSRIRAAAWEPLWDRVAGKRVYQSHGMADPDLSFEAALGLRDRLMAHGAHVDWRPFAGGHEMPLFVWRTLRRFLRSVELAPS